jgi:universal stress protein A
MSVYSHILVAIDFSDSSEHVLARAREIAQGNNARLSLLYVMEYLPPIDYINDSLMDINWVTEEKVLLDHAKDKMQQFGKKHELDNVALQVELGSPKHEISRYVKEHDCDLVVLGSHGRHGISLLLGSTANAVLHDMPCDVLTVKIEN